MMAVVAIAFVTMTLSLRNFMLVASAKIPLGCAGVLSKCRTSVAGIFPYIQCRRLASCDIRMLQNIRCCNVGNFIFCYVEW